MVAPPVTNNNPETAVGDGDAQTYCVESENLCADDKYSCTGESSLEFYLNQSLFDLKKHDIFLYEQHLMLKAFLISACECWTVLTRGVEKIKNTLEWLQLSEDYNNFP